VNNLNALWNRLSVRLGIAFMAASILGVALVGILAYRSSTSELVSFISSMQNSGCLTGGMMGNQLIIQAQDDFFNRIASFLWIAGGAGVAVALILGWGLSRQIVHPLSDIARAARQVAMGNLDHKVETRSYGEVQDLAQSFNHMAQTLRHDRDLRRNMVADIAHELRTPLSILQGNIEGMQDGVIPTNSETLAALHAETLELNKLVEDLRTLSLAESGQLGFDLQPTDLNALVNRVKEEFKTQAASRRISLQLIPADGLKPVMADPARTAQVLRNLLDNALRYSSDSSSIEIKLNNTGDGVSVSVTDHGPGISSEHLPFVFERFYRVERSRARSSGGSGLGLAIAKQIVEAQGGKIQVESSVGQGSTFMFNLPYQAD
jgi:two-component system sensor histidine kinase BaeS